MNVAIARSPWTGASDPIAARLSLVTAPTDVALDVDSAKMHLRNTGDEEDELIEDLVQAATDYIEATTGRALITQTWDLTLDQFPNSGTSLMGTMNMGYFRERTYLGGWGLRPIFIPKAPLQSVASVQYTDTNGVLQTWSSSLYSVDPLAGPHAEPGRIFPVYGEIFPIARSMPGAIRIRFTAGYGPDASAVPSALKSVMRLLVGHWWLNREAGQIVRGSADILPFGVDAMLQPFVVY